MKRGRNNKLTTEEFIRRAEAIHGDEAYDYTKTVYIGANIPLAIDCKIHGPFNVRPSNHIRKMSNPNWKPNGCPICGKQKTIDRNVARTKTFQEIVEIARSIHGEYYQYREVISPTFSKRRHLIIQCPIHGEFSQDFTNHIRHGSGCIKCRESKGERIISKALHELGVIFEPQFRFEECRGDTHPLVFDFYIPTKNAVIEYQGEQHFFICSIHGMGREKAEKAFERQIRYDDRKRTFCSQQNIEMIEIKYDQLKNINAAYISKLF